MVSNEYAVHVHVARAASVLPTPLYAHMHSVRDGMRTIHFPFVTVLPYMVL